jgi:flagellar basal-body rod modification protein FlgD
MSTIGAIPTTPTLPSALTSSLPSTSSSPSNLSLTSSDFVNLMITQLQNQDPLNPTDPNALMQQVSEIGQLQSTTQLQTTLSGLASQTQIGAASNLIGKQVNGIDSTNSQVSGQVMSVQVSSSGVNLQLDSGSMVPLSNVTNISPVSGSGTTTPAS